MEREIIDDFRVILLKAREHDGEAWEMVVGELQLQFGEACLWVLIDEPEQAATALRSIREIVASYMQKWKSVTFTVTFQVIEGDEKLFLELLEGGEIIDDRHLSTIGKTFDRARLSPTDIFLTERTRRLKEG
ncbi:hypothetical protein LAV84_03465 [Rhizobium sp. VS19-DR104.2]|uniref:hypothetical protein n=1 Tax=unclassified Rhizobium TaxID=2613769 RepID=UPI001C5B1E57|nr:MULTISPECIES: hypothetical protein [unclassified Rhizobium]MBZ5758260.1 hypothetical protein [Rhizobium sp. VS19-DR96]MBZ5764910.1 hypothetical protein [Rhizobium sp. VS19-DR129.2]MBZ5772453.1 hypothetical protein [Rhizobium sp. VS19-DRK62.2]MBZ5782860.1 hypothetical protein [Rhizobium sp. VS19-DR121]MBZ5800308.1 hypothetical protein [Rhizobium sp. VS19-DR181]